MTQKICNLVALYETGIGGEKGERRVGHGEAKHVLKKPTRGGGGEPVLSFFQEGQTGVSLGTHPIARTFSHLGRDVSG